MKKVVKILSWETIEDYEGFDIDRFAGGDYGEIYDEDIESYKDLDEGCYFYTITCDDEEKMVKFAEENSHLKELGVYCWFDKEDNCWYWGNDIYEKGDEYTSEQEVKEACIEYCKNLIDDFKYELN